MTTKKYIQYVIASLVTATILLLVINYLGVISIASNVTIFLYVFSCFLFGLCIAYLDEK